MAIEADATFFNDQPGGGKAGLAAARAIGLLTYRGYEAYNQTHQGAENAGQIHSGCIVRRNQFGFWS